MRKRRKINVCQNRHNLVKEFVKKHKEYFQGSDYAIFEDLQQITIKKTMKLAIKRIGLVVEYYDALMMLALKYEDIGSIENIEKKYYTSVHSDVGNNHIIIKFGMNCQKQKFSSVQSVSEFAREKFEEALAKGDALGLDPDEHYIMEEHYEDFAKLEGGIQLTFDKEK